MARSHGVSQPIPGVMGLSRLARPSPHLPKTRFLVVHGPLEDLECRRAVVPSTLQSLHISLEVDRPVPERQVLVARLSMASMVVVEVREPESVPERREVRPGAVRSLVEVRVPNVQAVPQIRHSVEHRPKDFWRLVDVLDRHDDAAVCRGLGEIRGADRASMKCALKTCVPTGSRTSMKPTNRARSAWWKCDGGRWAVNRGRRFARVSASAANFVGSHESHVKSSSA